MKPAKSKIRNLPFEKVGECLYRNPSNGVYYGLVKVRGKQIKRSLDTNNLPVARRLLKDFRRDAERLDPAMGRLTLSKLIEKFRPTFLHQASGTKANKETVLERIESFWPGGCNRPVGRIKPSECRTFLSRYSGAAGYNHAREVLRALFALAVNDGIIADTPMVDIGPRKRETPIRPTPSTDEFLAIVASIRTQPFSDTAEESAEVVEFYGLAGLGAAETSALRLMDVNLERGQFITFRQKTSNGFAVPIFPQLRPLLERRIEKLFKDAGDKKPDPHAKIFSVSDPKVAIATACRRLELPAYSSRSFRRLFITTALERGVDVKVVAEWQGHRDGGKLILDTYSHVRPAHSELMAQRMTAV